jgi:hypothetical protein
MKVSFSRRAFIRMTAASSLSVATGCGMILHPERRGQPPGGSLDWSIVALDAVGLLLFFIPGVIAFAVDFATGAIYLPPPGFGDGLKTTNDAPLVEVQVPPEELTPERVEQVTSDHIGRDVKIVRGGFLTARLSKLTDFWSARERLAS